MYVMKLTCERRCIRGKRRCRTTPRPTADFSSRSRRICRCHCEVSERGKKGGTGKVRLDETKKVPSEIWEGLIDQKATARKIRRISRMPFDIIITKILTGSP